MVRRIAADGRGADKKSGRLWLALLLVLVRAPRIAGNAGRPPCRPTTPCAAQSSACSIVPAFSSRPCWWYLSAISTHAASTSSSTISGATMICRGRGDLDAAVSGFGRHCPRRVRWPVELKDFLDAKSTTVASPWSAMTYSVTEAQPEAPPLDAGVRLGYERWR
jgi:hypothetical protein